MRTFSLFTRHRKELSVAVPFCFSLCAHGGFDACVVGDARTKTDHLASFHQSGAIGERRSFVSFFPLSSRCLSERLALVTATHISPDLQFTIHIHSIPIPYPFPTLSIPFPSLSYSRMNNRTLLGDYWVIIRLLLGYSANVKQTST